MSRPGPVNEIRRVYGTKPKGIDLIPDDSVADTKLVELNTTQLANECNWLATLTDSESLMAEDFKRLNDSVNEWR